MSETYNAKLAIYVDTYANMSSKTPESGRLFFASDTGAFYKGDGSTAISSLNPLGYFDITNQRFGIGRDPTYPLDVNLTTEQWLRFQSDSANDVGAYINNSTNAWLLYNTGAAGSFVLNDVTGGTNPVIIQAGCSSSLFKLLSSDIVQIGGAFGYDTGGILTVTTGTYGALDIGGVGQIRIDTSGGNVDIQGLASGTDGQQIVVLRFDVTNSFIVRFNHGSGTQKIITIPSGTDNTYTTTRYKDTWQLFGTLWAAKD